MSYLVVGWSPRRVHACILRHFRVLGLFSLIQVLALLLNAYLGCLAQIIEDEACAGTIIGRKLAALYSVILCHHVRASRPGHVHFPLPTFVQFPGQGCKLVMLLLDEAVLLSQHALHFSDLAYEPYVRILLLVALPLQVVHALHRNLQIADQPRLHVLTLPSSLCDFDLLFLRQLCTYLLDL